jgi:hypothetical protein
MCSLQWQKTTSARRTTGVSVLYLTLPAGSSLLSALSAQYFNGFVYKSLSSVASSFGASSRLYP